MDTFKIVDGLDDHRWDRFVGAHACGHFLQSSAWGRLREAAGWELRRCLLADAGDRPVAGAQLLVQRRLGGRLAYVPRGPVCAPEHPAWPQLADALRQSTRDCVVLRLEPHWADGPPARAALEAAGLRQTEALQPPSTLRLDLGRGSETLLAEMKQKWRYNIRLAARKGVEVAREGAESLPTMESMIAETAERNGFPARAGGYYSAVYQGFAAADPESARLYVARHEGRALAAILVIHHARTATYLYGGSSDLERQRMPNHALQWHAILAAEAAGLGHYDLWGIPDAIGKAAVAGQDLAELQAGEGGLWGVWGFKRGFGGEVWRAVGAWDQVHAPVRYALATRWLPRWRALLKRDGR